MSKNIGATELRQRLTDVLLTVRESGEAYIVETFGRPQAALVNMDEYALFQRFRSEREVFFEWLEDTAARNAQHNAALSQEEILAIIEQEREDVHADVG